MPARTSTAFFFSALLHTAIVVALLAIAFTVQRRKPPPVVIFDLVAGPGNDLTATKAPARGTPEGGVDVKIPEPPVRAQPAAPEPMAQERAQAPTRTETKPAASEKPANRDAAKLTYDQYVKQHGKPSTSQSTTAGPSRRIAVPRITTRGIPDGVSGGSPDSKRGANGTAMSAAEHSALEGYISRLVSALRQNHEKPPGLSDLLAADVEFFIAADGTISRIRITHSSGNAAFDESCIEAFRRVGSIGPKPDGKSDTWILTFRMKDEE